MSKLMVDYVMTKLKKPVHARWIDADIRMTKSRQAGFKGATVEYFAKRWGWSAEDVLNLLKSHPASRDWYDPPAGPSSKKIFDVCQKILAIPDHLHPLYRHSIDALGEDGPKLKAIYQSWSELQDDLRDRNTRDRAARLIYIALS